jgi:hypothetical protein
MQRPLMGEQHYHAFLKSQFSRDDGVLREELWVALTSELQEADAGDTVNREQLLRELLDEAHDRVRRLEAALRLLTGAPDDQPGDDQPDRTP